jgi:two-component system, OmpR family, flagellar system response regulator FtcR
MTGDSEATLIAVIEDQARETRCFADGFRRQGVPSIKMGSDDFLEWILTCDKDDVKSIQGFVLGECPALPKCQTSIRKRSDAPIIHVQQQYDLNAMLNVFAAGFDDVVARSIDPLELLVRIRVIARRAASLSQADGVAGIVVFPDGRDPIVGGEPLRLPRRERHILEYLVANSGRRVTKAQIFNATYGLFDEDVEEQVVESHVSKLRRKLRDRLGEDPIDSQRYLGYCLKG